MFNSSVDVTGWNGATGHAGRFLVLADEGELWRECQLLLEENGAECSVARRARTTPIPDAIEVAIDDPLWLSQLLLSLDTSARPLTAVLCLAPQFASADPPHGYPVASLGEAARTAGFTLLCVVPRAALPDAAKHTAAGAVLPIDGKDARIDAPLILQSLQQLLAARSGPSLAEKLAELEPSRRFRACCDAVAVPVSRILGVELSSLRPETPFASLGIESLKALELRVALQHLTGLELPATELYNHPTIASVASYVLARFDGSADAFELGHDQAAEPIAIIGMACRLPGHVNSPEAYWQLLCTGTEAVSEVPPSRFDIDEYYDPNLQFPPAVGTTVSRRMGAIDDFDRFDAEFFGISTREAKEMDPQQRLLLEVCWEALENACLDVTALDGSATGVFVGLIPCGYAEQCVPTAHLGTGTSSSVAGGRISYCFGLRGPNLTIDTACSSSLVATHLACQSLRNRESRIALVAGVNLVVNSNGHVALSQLGALSPDGRCKAFDDSANGYVRGEGCAAIVLKRLSDALADGDPIWAVVRGSAVNQDGRSNGLTAPNGAAQQQLIRDALRNAGVAPHELQYVEAHGTGTALGDPIEINSLNAVTSAGRPKSQPLLVGSCKPNIGHLEPAAGIAGLIKAVLCLNHRQLPPSLFCEKPNSRVAWADIGIEVVRELRAWPESEAERIAGVSSFGFSGTNSHVILAGAPSREPALSAEPAPGASLLTVSARSRQALQELCRAYAAQIAHNPGQFRDICCGSNRDRAHHAYRAAFVAESAAELLAALADEAKIAALGDARPKRQARVAWLCTGQGAQFPAMARALYASEPVFREWLDECDRLSQRELPKSLRQVLLSDDPDVHQTRFTQPALFAFEVAMAALWRQRGVTADLLIGHSVGEFSAAFLAEVFSLEDALRLVCARARLIQDLPTEGGMLALSLSRAEVDEWVRGHADVSVAAYNAPNSVVVSGAWGELTAIERELAARGLKSRRLQVSHAFHSAQMEPILDAFEAEARTVALSAPRCPIVSNVTGQLMGAEMAQASYWREHLRAPVDFENGVRTAAKHANVFLELGPQPTLVALAASTLENEPVRFVGSWRSQGEPQLHLARASAELYTAGVQLDFAAIGPKTHAKIRPPAYPFRRERYWHGGGSKARGRSGLSVHPLLGAKLDNAAGPIVYEAEWALSDLEYLADHRVFDRVVVPGAAVIETFVAALREVAGEGACGLADIVFEAPLVLEKARPLRVQCVVEPADGEGFGLSLHAYTKEGAQPGTWRRCAAARSVAAEGSRASAERIAQARHECSTAYDLEGLYDPERLGGLAYGPAFRGLKSVVVGQRQALGEVVLAPAQAAEVSRYTLHPAALDASLHALFALRVDAGEGTYVPMAVDRLRVFSRAESKIFAHVELQSDPGQEIRRARVLLWDEFQQPVAELEGLTLRRVSESARPAETKTAGSWYEIRWQHTPLVKEARLPSDAAPQQWLVITLGTAASTRLGSAIAARLRLNATCHEAHFDAHDDATALQGVRARAAALLERMAPAERAPVPGVVVVCDPEPDQDVSRAATAITLATINVLREALGRVRVVRLLTIGATPVCGAAPALSVAPLFGLARSLQQEFLHGGFAHLDLDATDPHGSLELALAELAVATAVEGQVAFRRGERWLPRLVRSGALAVGALNAPNPELLAQAERDKTFQLKVGAGGLLEALSLEPCVLSKPAADQVRLRVLSAGINFRDVLNALGMYKGEAGPLGCECVAQVEAVGANVNHVAVGDVVMGLAPGCFAPFVNAPAAALIRKPENLTVEESATIPLVFLTALYAFKHLAGLRKGQRVLIHSAAGGVGMAAILLAKHLGLEVFATASPGKWAAVRRLGVRHVMSSRNVEFAETIRRVTEGRGVDAVLNSFTGEFISQGLSLLSPGGYFLEMGKAEILSAAEVERAAPGIHYRPFDLADATSAQLQEMLAELKGAFETGVLQPLPRTVYELADAPHAFRHMSQAKHVGKNLLRVQELEAAPWVRPDSSYLISGGWGTLGLELARALAQAGAAHLVLLGRSAPSETAQSVLRTIEQSGTKVELVRADISQASALAAIRAGAHERPPLRGIFHAAGVLADATLAQTKDEDVRRVTAPKIAGAWHLHELAQGLELDHFVLFSSASSLIGWAGQSGYAAANAFLDGLAHHRRALGLPALSVNWGPWAGEGMAASLGAGWAAAGIQPLPTPFGLAALRQVLTLGRAQVAVITLNWPRFLLRYQGGQMPGIVQGFARAVVPNRDHGALQRLLAKVAPGERSQLIVDYLSSMVRSALSLPAEADISAESHLLALGVDSLAAVQLRNRLANESGVNLRSTALFEHATIGALSAHLERELQKLGAESLAPAMSKAVAPSAQLPA